ncbi:hypothetical protein GCM10007860_19240 [Chitiniphilus shinanonensis]|uniref:Secreted protein n=1 Tax=Chitiniphilus shinanonensis TaxID=553088 RepID=A0ABQ6BSL5_9NEIS|nr:hypothetical protein [Chitiniphilus shinanonensis]GLS04776.1 hypothetical protein GCM10007860_19240 [Chitiniphilus shinanonensis]
MKKYIVAGLVIFITTMPVLADVSANCEKLVSAYFNGPLQVQARKLVVHASADHVLRVALSKAVESPEWREGNPYWEEAYQLLFDDIAEAFDAGMSKLVARVTSDIAVGLSAELCDDQVKEINSIYRRHMLDKCDLVGAKAGLPQEGILSRKTQLLQDRLLGEMQQTSERLKLVDEASDEYKKSEMKAKEAEDSIVKLVRIDQLDSASPVMGEAIESALAGLHVHRPRLMKIFEKFNQSNEPLSKN